MSSERKGRSVTHRLGAWSAELVLVFIGAYAAFWLNNYQERQRDAQRRDVILASLEEEVRASINGAQAEAEMEERQAAAFRRALEAGELPTLRPFSFISDYSPTDVATLLQSGGVELLDPKTLIALRNVESTLRRGLALMTRYERLSDQLIVPNVDQEPSFFYDPTTGKLRKRFEDYPQSIEDTAQFFRNLETAQTDLLKQMALERRQHK
jgi:hypothetical protein